MKTKGPPIFLFIIALIGAGVLVYVNFSQSDGIGITEMINRLKSGDTVTTSATVSSDNSDNSESKSDESMKQISNETTESVDESQAPEEIDAVKAFDALSDINVDRNLLTVKMDFPADFVGEMTQEQVEESVTKDPGILSGVLNSDGSVTYVLSYFKYKEMLDETKKSIDDGLKEIVDSDEFPDIVGITHNDDFTEYTVKYKGKEVSFTDSFQVLACYMYSGFYAIFKGEPIENVHVTFVNSETGAVIMESNSKDMGKEQN